jgi:hypothetical protein
VNQRAERQIELKISAFLPARADEVALDLAQWPFIV